MQKKKKGGGLSKITGNELTLFCRLSSDKRTEVMHLQTGKNLNNQTANKCQHFIIVLIFAVELLS